jgi:6-phosphogluconolactonase
MGVEIKIVPDSATLSRVAAHEFENASNSAIVDHGRFIVALSGGNTPRSVYALIAEEYKTSLPWEKIHIFFGDERYVPAGDPDSNFRMAHETLFSRAPIPAQNVHRVRTELDPESAAKDYEAQVRAEFGLKNDELPRFDLILLGLGDDGHTASLFPGTTALNETSRLVAPNWVEKLKTFRITLTFPVLNHAAEDLFIVSGAAKAEIVAGVLGASSPPLYPSQRVRPEHGRLLWIIDQDAATLLPAEKFA